jgi:hypothetical protein
MWERNVEVVDLKQSNHGTAKFHVMGTWGLNQAWIVYDRHSETAAADLDGAERELQ